LDTRRSARGLCAMDEKRKTVSRWLDRAEHDLYTAGTMLRVDNPPTDVVCFHCQQCAEKCVKAFLVSVGREFPKTHDLMRLLTSCAEENREFAELEEDLMALTDYAVEVRYVDDWRDISVAEAELALEAAERVIAFVRRLL
jgi:HEPN domain-containing protein